MATDKLYDQVAKQLAGQIDRGLYGPGDRLPGVRRLARQFGVSISTIVQAQRLLEDDGRIEARPRSGYYVRAQTWPRPQEHAAWSRWARNLAPAPPPPTAQNPAHWQPGPGAAPIPGP